jgi:2-polyprenyl-6-methoxyphenol hydroxylase-like FAD-dependent oxidoreductase
VAYCKRGVTQGTFKWISKFNQIAIIGAGPTGMTLAIALAEQGIQALILDKQAEGANTSRAVVIHARTLEVLRPLGVVDELLRAGRKVSTFCVRDQDRLLLEIGFDKLPTDFPFTLMCPQEVTEKILLSRLKAVGGQVIRPAELTGLRQQDGEMELDVLHTGAATRLQAKWVVGCDGGHSIVRQSVGIGFQGSAYPEDFVLADVHMDWPLGRDEVSLFFAAEGLVVVAPLPGDHFRVVATVDKAPDEVTLGFLQDLIDRRGPRDKPGQIQDIIWTSRFRIQHRVADTMSKDNILLCGDAAHVHSPAGGQGMNTGIQDAASLAGPLVTALKSGNTQELEIWAARRHDVAKNVVGMTDTMTRAATLDSAPLRSARNAALALIGHIPAARNAIANTLAELKYR